ncbi:MAG TPA: amino acid ABC transporter substrate-binding protein, partial [Roseiarcus sp.]|nr:amino acid ABC transporter substrate-binding protein [Roseiarcus sp.]
MIKGLLGALIGAAIMVWGGSAAAQTKTIVIGYELPLTGDSSHYGEVFRNAADIKLQEFKIAGGVPGADVVIRYEDSKN